MKIAITIGVIIVGAMVFFVYSADDKPNPPLKSTHVAQPKTIRPKKVDLVSNPFVQQAVDEFENFIRTELANKQAPGVAVAIVRDTSIILVKGYGLREVGKPDSVDAQTVFRVGSVSKSITATLAAELVNENIIHWDDPVIKYLPRFKLKSERATQQLKIRHILSHTEGLPYHAFTDMVDRNAPVDTLINYLSTLDLIDEPGKVYSYQNVGFSLIGKVIEAATHKSFEEVLTEKLFLPLGMKNASASLKKIKSNADVAMPHQLILPLTISSAYYSVAPAGGINASAFDLALWLKALLTSNTVLSAGPINEMLQPQVRAVARNLYFWQWKPVRKSYYALGWRIVTFRDDTIAYHGGYVNHYRSEVAINRKKKIAIAVLVNSPGPLADQAIPRFFKIYDQHLDSINYWKPKPLVVNK